MSARRLAKFALVLLAIGAPLIGYRVTHTRTWQPVPDEPLHSFVLLGLFLFPLGAFLLAGAGVWRLWERKTGRRAHGLSAAAVIVLVASVAACVFTSQAFTLLYGEGLMTRAVLGPPAGMTSLDQITEKSAMRFPKSAVLVDGMLRVQGIIPHLIAEVRLPAEDVDEFLREQRAPFSWSDITRNADTGSLRNLRVDLMRGRGWPVDSARHIIAARANTAPGPSEICEVMIDLDDPKTAVLYIYWEQT
jgi:hypothetical protein